MSTSKLDKLLEESQKSPCTYRPRGIATILALSPLCLVFATQFPYFSISNLSTCRILSVTFGNILGKKDYADIAFHVGAHTVYAHLVLIESRCPLLLTVGVKDKGRKGNLMTIKTDDKVVDVRSLTLVLEYLYTGTIPFSEVKPAELVMLMAHTALYDMTRLGWLCERYLKSILDNDYFFTLLALSNGGGVERAKKLCMQYGSLHFEELIVMADKVRSLGVDLFRDFVVYSTLNHEPIEDLDRKSFPHVMRDEFKVIFTSMKDPDAFFVFKQANTSIPCHKAVIFAQSDKFKPLLDEGAADGRYTLPKNITLSPEAFRSFLSWSYWRDTSFSAAHAAEILPLAHDFEMEALVTECAGKLRKGINITSVLPILNLCFSNWGKLGYRKDHEGACLFFIVQNFAHLDLSPLNSAEIAAAIAGAIRKAVIDGLWASASSGPSEQVSSAPVENGTTPHTAPAAAHLAPGEIPAGRRGGRHSRPNTDEDGSLESSDKGKSAKAKKSMTITLSESTDAASGSETAHVEAKHEEKKEEAKHADSSVESPKAKETKPAEAKEEAKPAAEAPKEDKKPVEEPKEDKKPAEEPKAEKKAEETAPKAEEPAPAPAKADEKPAEPAPEEKKPAPVVEEKKSEPAPVEEKKDTAKDKKPEPAAEHSASPKEPTPAAATPEPAKKASPSKSGSSTAIAATPSKSSEASSSNSKDKTPSSKEKEKEDKKEKEKEKSKDKKDKKEKDKKKEEEAEPEKPERKDKSLAKSPSVKAIKESFEAKGRTEEKSSSKPPAKKK